MLVTVPPLLLLLDFWPLRRFRRAPPDTAAPSERRKSGGRGAWPEPFPWLLVVDKLPLFALAIAAAVVTILTHTTRPSYSSTMSERLANAAVSCVAYLGNFFVPVGLSPFYSLPEAGRPAWQVAGAVALFLAITTAAVIWRRAWPYFFVGWFWYVGMLAPVLGLTFVGAHARADRYTYLSQIGLYIALGLGGEAGGCVVAGSALGVWHWLGLDVGSPDGLQLASDELLARRYHAVGTSLGMRSEKRPGTPQPRRALEEKDEKGAVAQYRQALELGTNERNIYNGIRAQAHNALGAIAARKGDIASAVAHYVRALEVDPDFATGHLNLGGIQAERGNFDEAMVHLRRSIELEPNNPAVYCSLAVALAQHHQTDEAIVTLRRALKADPNSVLAHMHLATLLAERDEVGEAIVHYRRVIEIDPAVAYPYYQIARWLRQQGKTSEAVRYDERGKTASRRYAETQHLRGTELAEQGRIDEAIVQFEAAIAAFPDFAQAHNDLADVLASRGNIPEAILHYRQALAIDPNFAPAKRSLDRLLHR